MSVFLPSWWYGVGLGLGLVRCGWVLVRRAVLARRRRLLARAMQGDGQARRKLLAMAGVDPDDAMLDATWDAEERRWKRR